MFSLRFALIMSLVPCSVGVCAELSAQDALQAKVQKIADILYTGYFSRLAKPYGARAWSHEDSVKEARTLLKANETKRVFIYAEMRDSFNQFFPNQSLDPVLTQVEKLVRDKALSETTHTDPTGKIAEKVADILYKEVYSRQSNPWGVSPGVRIWTREKALETARVILRHSHAIRVFVYLEIMKTYQLNFPSQSIDETLNKIEALVAKEVLPNKHPGHVERMADVKTDLLESVFARMSGPWGLQGSRESWRASAAEIAAEEIFSRTSTMRSLYYLQLDEAFRQNFPNQSVEKPLLKVEQSVKDFCAALLTPNS